MVDTATPGASTAPSGAEDDDFDIVNAEEVDGVDDTTADEDDDAIPDLDEDGEVCHSHLLIFVLKLSFLNVSMGLLAVSGSWKAYCSYTGLF